ncbi:MAG: hypothetical protein MUC51_12170, partial [Anaerolineae bacterium]|nr:hypothetical protein [Anaerolineae bacterium]
MKLRQSFSRPGFWIVGLSLLWAGLLVSNIVPELRGSHGWQWPIDFVHDPRRLLLITLGVIAYIGVAFRLLQNRSAAGLLLWAMAGSIGLPLAAAYVRDDLLFRFFSITVSGVTGWHRAAASIQDLGATLRDWPAFIAVTSEYSSHVALSPPGLVVIYYAANAFLTPLTPLADWLVAPLRLLQCHDMALMANSNARLASAWLGMLTPVWGSLTILILYRLGRSMFGPDTARWAVIWWPLVPSFLIFAPLPYTLYPLPALIMIDLLLVGLRRNRPARVLLAGMVMSALTFVSFALMPLILLAGLLTLGIYWINIRRSETASPWHWPLQMGLWYGLGLSTVWLIYYAVAGLSPWALMLAASPGHLALDRPYWPWLVLHANDFFMFTGWP